MGILHGVILYELTNVFFYAWCQPLFYFIHLFHPRLGWRELVPEGTVLVPKPLQKGHIGMPCCHREVQEWGWTWKSLCPKSLFFLFFHRLNVEAVPKAQCFSSTEWLGHRSSPCCHPHHALTPTGPHPFLHWTKLTFTAGQGGGHPEHLHIQQSDLASEEISDKSLRARRRAPTHLTATGWMDAAVQLVPL